MEIGPGPDQRELADAVRAVLAAGCPADVVRQSMTDPQRWQPPWKSAIDLGWTSLADPGGETGLGTVDLAVVLEECGAALAPFPLLSSVGLAAGALRGADGALDATLADIAGGAVATLAVQVAGQRLPGAPMRMSGGRVCGRATAVTDLVRAELIITLAATDDGGLVAAVLAPGAGVRIEPVESVDPSRPLADLQVDTVPSGFAPVTADAALAVPLLAVAAELAGVATAALDRCVEHAKTRVQFGKPIGAFQGVKHALADNYVRLQRARSLIYAAASCLDDPASTAAAAWTAAALAKAAAGDAALAGTRYGVQVHGALGQTWEHDMHLYLRRAWGGSALLGDSRALYSAVGARFLEGTTA